MEREALPQPAERRRGIFLQQLLEARGDVDHRRLRERRERLVGGLHREVRAARLVHGVVAHRVALPAPERVERVEVEVRGPCLVRVEQHARLFAETRNLPHGVEHALVGAGGEDEEPRAGGRRQLVLDVLEGHGSPHAQPGVPAGGQVTRHRAGGHYGVVDALVAVAVDQHRLARTQQRHQHRLVRGGRAVRDVAALRRAEDLAREFLRLGEGRACLGAGEVAQRLHRHGEVGAENRPAVGLEEPAKERRRGERAPAVVSGRVPVRAGLRGHVLTERRGEARHPEALEEMHDPLAAFRRMREDGEVLLRPAARGERHVGMARTRHHHLGDGGEEELHPGAQRTPLDVGGHESVVDEEQAARAPGVRQHPARPAAREERTRQVVRRMDGHELQRRVVERTARVERLAAEVAERIREAILHHRQVLRVQPVRRVEIENRQRPDHGVTSASTRGR